MRLVNNTECVCDIPDLLPCPFCGSDNVDIWNGEFGIYCVDCGAIGPGAPNEAEAAKRWNSRKPRERLLTKIEHLEFEKDRLYDRTLKAEQMLFDQYAGKLSQKDVFEYVQEQLKRMF